MDNQRHTVQAGLATQPQQRGSALQQPSNLDQIAQRRCGPGRAALLMRCIALAPLAAALAQPHLPAQGLAVNAPSAPAAIVTQSVQTAAPDSALPAAPQPQQFVQAGPKPPVPCPAQSQAAAVAQSAAATGQTAPSPCLNKPPTNWFERFLTGPEVKPLTPKEKARLAMRNVLDPFNNLTILADAAIAVGSDADGPYGPGMKGWGRNVGVSYTQDLTGEFLCTFLIPSVMHQDPHYHRMPKATIPRRMGHAMLQVLWTQGDNGKGMLNYAYIAGAAGADEISNLYVPGRRTNLPSSAERYATGLATAPIDNLVSEFLPDVARHIHVQIVVIQRIINQVAKTNDGLSLP